MFHSADESRMFQERSISIKKIFIKYLIKLLNKRQPSAVVICAIHTSFLSLVFKNFDSHPKPLL